MLSATKTENVNLLRPDTLSEVVGQSDIKQCLNITIESARIRDDVIPHSLFLGPAGLGKTTLALATANELGKKAILANGAGMKKIKDILPYLRRLKRGDVLFIDECHRIPPQVQENLFTVMEDFRFDIANTGRSMHFEKFTLIGATTDPGLMLKPFRDRFVSSYHLQTYSNEEMETIVSKNIIKLGLGQKATKGAVRAIARRSRGVPRIANSHALWIRDCMVHGKRELLNEPLVSSSMKMKGIGPEGDTRDDRKYVDFLKEQYGPAGLSTICASTGLDMMTVTEIIEPFLLSRNIIKKTPRGRELI